MFGVAPEEYKDILDDPVLRSRLSLRGIVGFSDLFDGTGRSPQLSLYGPHTNKSGPSPPVTQALH